MAYKDPVKAKEYYEKNKEQLKEKRKEYREKNKARIKERQKEADDKRCEVLKRHAYDSITSGKIIDQNMWDVWCSRIKSGAKNKHPYSDDFTRDVMFEMMVRGCFYCGYIATTVDRIDSKLGHTPDNCVGCCHGCNISKGAADPATFIKKAYYRAREKYYDDDTDIWFVHKNKPRLDMYNTHAKKQGVSFDLTKEDFDILTIDNCKYCKRSPTTWFGIDREIPSLGYVSGNVVSCCWDCNLDKSTGDVDTVVSRNERIAVRVEADELIIKECEKVILRIGLAE